MFDGASGDLSDRIGNGAGPVFGDNECIGAKAGRAPDDIPKILGVLDAIEGAEKGIFMGCQSLQEIVGVGISELVSFETDMGFDALELIEKGIFGEDTELNALGLRFPDALVEYSFGPLFNPDLPDLPGMFFDYFEDAIFIC